MELEADVDSDAFANHGFLPRNGYATITQYIEATTQVVGMGPNLALFLSTLGAAVDGSGTAWCMSASLLGVLMV